MDLDEPAQQAPLFVGFFAAAFSLHQCISASVIITDITQRSLNASSDHLQCERLVGGG